MRHITLCSHINAKRRLYGISLLEVVLAIAISSMVLVASINGLNRYGQSIRVQATSGLVTRLRTAAGQFADDNYSDLVAAAPQELSVNVLQPYVGSTVKMDAFRDSFVISTRKYTYTVPDPANPGNTLNRDGLQLLIVGKNSNANAEIRKQQTARVDVANSIATGGGYIADDTLKCADSGGAALPAGTICGAFGGYAFQPSKFPKTDFSDATITALVNKGDSSHYGDQLYRYDYGDPELNTMHTNLKMDGNGIEKAKTIDGTESFQMASATGQITNPDGDIQVAPTGGLKLSPKNGQVTLNSDGTAGHEPRIKSATGTLRVGSGADNVVVGDVTSEDMTGPNGDTTVFLGTGTLNAGVGKFSTLRTDTINDLHQRSDKPLKLQNISGGQVLIGKRARYHPPNGASANPQPTYEVSDGTLTTGMVKSQDISCADCGGDLSKILPRWRHMGTYYVAFRSGNILGITAYTKIPKPNCSATRRDTKTGANVGSPSRTGGQTNNERYQETTNDQRYEPRVIVTPKHIVADDSKGFHGGGTPFNIDLAAYDVDPNYWRVQVNHFNDYVKVTALANTYCVFVGGEPQDLDPTNPTSYTQPVNSGSPNSTYYELPGNPG